MNRIVKNFFFCVILVLCITMLILSIALMSKRNLSHARIDLNVKEIFKISSEFDYDTTTED